jgi:hypothetical protein
MDRATIRAVVIRVLVVAVTLVVMLLIALIRGAGNAEASIDLARVQHAAVAAVMANVQPTTVTTIGYDEVVDATAGRAYLEQTAELFLADGVAVVAGTYEYGSIRSSAVAGFHRSLGVAPGDWADTNATGVVFLLWHAEEGVFSAARPRPGFDPPVAGDTLVVLLDPVTGLETRAVVAYEDTATLREQATNVITGPLTLGG